MVTSIEVRETSLPDSSVVEELDNCSICLTPINIEKKTTLEACSHIFHTACIESWAQAQQPPSCPLCREVFTLPDTRNGCIRAFSNLLRAIQNIIPDIPSRDADGRPIMMVLRY